MEGTSSAALFNGSFELLNTGLAALRHHSHARACVWTQPPLRRPLWPTAQFLASLYRGLQKERTGQVCCNDNWFFSRSHHSLAESYRLTRRPGGVVKAQISSAQVFESPLRSINTEPSPSSGPTAAEEALQLLEWNRICATVSTFASTSSGKQHAGKLILPASQEESEKLLQETAAALTLDSSASGDCLDFGSIDTKAAEYGLYKARKSVPMTGQELRLTATVLSASDRLLRGVTTAIRLEERELALQRSTSGWEDPLEQAPSRPPSLQPLMELVQAIMPHPEIVKAIDNVIDETGEVKDSASPELRKARQQVHTAEEKLKDLLGGFSDRGGKIMMQNDRLCLSINTAFRDTVPGLLLGSGGDGSLFVEPPAAVSLNNKLAEAKRQATAAEDAVRKAITERLSPWLEDITTAMDVLVKVDVIAARARCARWLKAARPTFVKIEEKEKIQVRRIEKRPEENKYASLATRSEEEEMRSQKEQVSTSGWAVSDDEEESSASESNDAGRAAVSESPLFLVRLEKALHPLLVLQHQEALKKAKQKVKSRAANLKRAKQRGMFGPGANLETLEGSLRSAEQEEAELLTRVPVPIDITIRPETRVVAITGPNTGGKTAAIKTLGLAALMAKAGLYVPAKEPVLLPWFDAALCDIGDDQSLVQSLSTFSGHLRRIKRIKAESTGRSLVLLDEVGGGTDPTEGAALGMALLQSFAEGVPGGSLLTMATTHHGELKTLKYSDVRFENACVEFDEEKLAPTFRLLWGIPGRSNALNIAERLGLDGRVIADARDLHGEANLEASEAILDLERQRKTYSESVEEAERLLKEARRMQRQLLAADKRLKRHQGPLLLKQANDIETCALQAREQISHLQKVLRGQLAARERQMREAQEQKAHKEEEERLRERKLQEAAESGNAFGALAGLRVKEGGLSRDGGRPLDVNGGLLQFDREQSKREGGALRQTEGVSKGDESISSSDQNEAKSVLKERSQPRRPKGGNPFASLRDQIESKQRVVSKNGKSKEDSDGREADAGPTNKNAGSTPSRDLSSALLNDSSEGIRTARGIKKLGAKMKKRPNQVIIPEAPPVEKEGATKADVSSAVDDRSLPGGHPPINGSQEKHLTEEDSLSSDRDRDKKKEGNGLKLEEKEEARTSGDSAPAKEKELVGWKGQLAQLKNLQRR